MRNFKKLAALLLAGCILCGMPFAVQATETGSEETVQLLSATVTDLTSWQVTLTFSEPVQHHMTTGTNFVYLCDVPEPSPGKDKVNSYGETYTSWQAGMKSLEYVNDTDNDGYSDTLKLTFNKPSGYTTMPNDAGVRITEYAGYVDSVTAADYNNGKVNANIISTADGKAVASTYMTGVGVDIAWMPVTAIQASVYPQSVNAVDKDTVQVNFTAEVSLTESGIHLLDSLEDTAGHSLAAVQAVDGIVRRQKTYAKTWSLDMDNTQLTGTEILLFAANSGVDFYDQGLVTDTTWQNASYAGIYLSEWNDPNTQIDHGTQNDYIVSGQAYNFMNCDTGRSLTLGNSDTFVLEKLDGVNMYAVKDSTGNYISLKGTTPTVSAVPSPILIYPCAHDRYQIFVTPDSILVDQNAGTTAAAETALVDKGQNGIETGWYLTKAGDTRPLKLLPLGDSLTDGVNYDRAEGEPMVSYRAQLSQKLTDYFGRIVFVGPKRSVATTIDETRLLRHAGYSGYVVEQIWEENTYEETYQHPGIEPFIDDITTKYTPDIVCLMLGTNDLSQINTNIAHTGKTQAQLIEEWLPVYEDFARRIEETMGVNGMVICSSLTLAKNTNGTGGHKTLSDKIEQLVEQMAEDGVKTCFADNYAATVAVGDSGINAKDTVHLNATGYAAVAETWYDVITTQYGSDSLRTVSLQEILDTATGTAVLNQDYTVDQLNVPVGVTLDLNGHTLTANHVVGIGQVIDSHEGEGGIKLDRNVTGDNKLILPVANAMFPLYDTDFGGYRFFTVSIRSMQKDGLTSDSYKFGSQFNMNDKAFALLMDAVNADAVLRAKLDLTIDDTLAYDITPFEFKASTLALYADKKLHETGNWAITLTVYGFDSLSGKICVDAFFSLHSSTGVMLSSPTLSEIFDINISFDEDIEYWQDPQEPA